MDEDDQDMVDAAEIAGSTCASPSPLSAAEFTRADANADCLIDQADLDVVNEFLGVQPDSPRYEDAWDAENRLISITPAALPVYPVLGAYYYKVAYRYDYLGRRFERTVSDYNYMTDAWDLVHERRRFVWGSAPAGSEWLMLREIIDTDTTSPPDGSFDENRTRNYAWGRDLAGHGGGSSGSASCGTGLAPVGCLTAAGGIGGLLAVLDDNAAGSDLNYVYTYDANGNVGQVVDYAAGSASAGMVAKYVYEAYGSTVGKAGSYADVNTFRFSTKYWDDPAGLGYWGYRYYDAGLGWWISRDPIGEFGGNSLYLYSSNAPIARVDAYGMQDSAPTMDSQFSADKKYCNPKDCCEGEPDPEGWVECCKQELVICLGQSGLLKKPELKACLVAHERVHEAYFQADHCRGRQDGPLGPKERHELGTLECKAHSAALKRMATIDCKKEYSKAKDQKDCKERIKNKKRWTCNKMTKCAINCTLIPKSDGGYKDD